MPRRSRPPPSGPLAETFSEIRDALRGTEPEVAANGYDPEPVCIACLVMLQGKRGVYYLTLVTAAPVQTLRGLPLKRLKDYLSAYDIPVIGVKEKEDLVEAVVKARNPATGCLFTEYESYYRRKSVPKRGRLPTGNAAPRPQARPPPQPQPARAQPRPMPSQSRPSQPRPPPPHYAQNPPPPRAPQSQAPPARPPQSPPPPVPTILSLVALPRTYLSTLSIGTLKAILYENHVRVDFKQVLEKEELVTRVFELVGAERRRLERQRLAEERELAEEQRGAEATVVSEDPEDTLGTSPQTATDRPAPSGPAPDIDRGLCVVCQDEEATLAVVDCGHLAMCQHCSDLIMATSKECPLCRTRIITPWVLVDCANPSQRLIRIYRV